MVENGLGRSWKVPKAYGRFHKFPDSAICAPPPLSLGGKAPRGVWPKLGGGGALLGEESSLDSDSPVGRTPFGSRSPRGTPHPLIAPKGPPGHLYKEGQGWGRSTTCPQGLCATLPPSKPRCSTIRP